MRDVLTGLRLVTPLLSAAAPLQNGSDPTTLFEEAKNFFALAFKSLAHLAKRRSL